MQTNNTNTSQADYDIKTQREVKVTKISLNSPNPLLDMTSQSSINQQTTYSTQQGRGTQLSSYISTRLNSQPRTINNYQTSHPTVIKSSKPGLAYSTNSYTSTFNALSKSPTHMTDTGAQYFNVITRIERPSNFYVNSNGQTTQQIYRHSNVHLTTTNTGKEIIKEVPIFLEKIIEKPVIVEKTVEIEVDRPVYIDRKVETVKPQTITVEKIIEKPVEKIVYVSKQDPEVDRELIRLREKVSYLEADNIRLKNENAIERVVEINKETVTTITDEHELKEWENKVKVLEAKLMQLEASIKHLEHDNIRLTFENDNLRKEATIVSDLKEKNHNILDELHLLKQKMITANTLNDERSMVDSKLAMETQQLKQEIAEIKNQYKYKLSELEAAKSRSDDALAVANSEMSKLKLTLEFKDKEQLNMSTRVNEHEINVTRLKLENDKYIKEIDQLKSQNSQLIHNLEDSKVSVQRKLDDQHLSLSELYKNQVENYKTMFEERNAEYSALVKRVDNQENLISDLEHEKQQLTRMIIDSQDKNRDLMERLDYLEIKEEILEDKIEDHKPFEVNIDTLEDLRDKNMTIKDEYEQMIKGSVMAMEQQLEEAYQKITKKQEKNKLLKQKLSFNTFRLIAAVSELERLRQMTTMC